MLNDSFYTPRILAERLVAFSKKRSLRTVADFCVGDGELLRAAKKKWSHIKCFGSDISEDAITATRKIHPDWHLTQLDFLDNEARAASPIIRSQPLFDLILMNPPFSCKGGTIHPVEFEGRKYKSSTAMRFLVTALGYLSKQGVMYAILPTSVAYSQKDNQLWCELERKYNLSILDEPQIQYFKGCAPNVILVSINDLSQVSNFKSNTRISLDFENLMVFRGKFSMDSLKKTFGQHFLVHTTNIKNNRLVDLEIKHDKSLSEITGPAILIPRVGKPKQSKICVIECHETYVISDCIIAIKTDSVKQANVLYRYFLDNWFLVESMYKGTGARYTTIEKVEGLLNLDIKKTSTVQKVQAI